MEEYLDNEMATAAHDPDTALELLIATARSESYSGDPRIVNAAIERLKLYAILRKFATFGEIIEALDNRLKAIEPKQEG